MHKGWAQSTKRAGILTALALLALAVGPSGADASQPALPDKWPACYFHPTGDSLTPRLRRMYERRQIAAGVDSSKVARTELRWHDVDSPYLATLLPDTRWYLMEAWNDNTPIGRPPCFAVAVRDDTSYRHWQINRILAAAGLLSDPVHHADVARIAVCFGLLDETSYRLRCRPTLPITYTASDFPWEHRLPEATARYALDASLDSARQRAQQRADSANEDMRHRLTDSTAIPAIEFLKLEIEAGFLASGDSGSARVTCNVAERPRTFHLTSSRGVLTRMYEQNGPSIAYDTLPATKQSTRRDND
jgi:hypothetical protein